MKHCDYDLVEVLDKQRINQLVQRLATRLRRNGHIFDIAIVVLNGAFCFAADLLKHIRVAKYLFVQAQSYEGTERGKIALTGWIKPNDVRQIAGARVLLIEDIVDSGHTIMLLRDYMYGYKAASVHAVAFICNDERASLCLDFAINKSELGRGFLVGYGLDYNGKYRTYRSIHKLEFKEKTNET